MRKPGEPADGACAGGVRELPSVDRILRLPESSRLIAEHGHTLVAEAVREVLADARSYVLSGGMEPAAFLSKAALDTVRAKIDARLVPRLRSLLNLTGTVIHTNFGRALLCDAAVHRLLEVMRSPCNLEYDLSIGSRGERDSIVEELLCTITGAEAATVVNNNAAAVLLTIAALAQGREVIVSRGELVEIGGAFRMPDVMAAADAKLVEVGTTNRTHRHDYELAVSERTALLLKVHTSNYAINGFTSSVCERELAEVAHCRGLTLASDLGAGSLVDLSLYGLPREPTPSDKLAAGCDVVSFSADKLLGGPQARLIVGSRSAIGDREDPPFSDEARVASRKVDTGGAGGHLAGVPAPREVGARLADPTFAHQARRGDSGACREAVARCCCCGRSALHRPSAQDDGADRIRVPTRRVASISRIDHCTCLQE